MSSRQLIQLVDAAHRETTLVVLGIALIALHVLDDNFLQPQPGTSAADHLFSGLVPLAVLLGIAAAHSRLRGGLRAAIVGPLGLLGVVAGASEAGYYSLKVGPTGDDYTGLLAIAAGLLLMCVGAVILWRTRRTDDSLNRRYLRRVLLVVATAVGAYFVLGPLALSYAITHAARAVVPKAELGAAYEQVSFTTTDGLSLKGWYVPSRNRAAIVSAPGRAGSQRPARMLARHGYGVLLFDRRGEGESDGDPNALGWSGAKDLKAAVAFLEHRADVDPNRIGGIGLSVGGENLLEAAATTQGLRAVVSDGAGSRSIREDLARSGSGKWQEVPTSVVLTLGTALFSNQAPPPNLRHLVGRIAPRPVFLIYGEHDQPNVIELSPRYYDAAGEPRALWEVPGATHTNGIVAHPKEYERRVVGFFDHALRSDQGGTGK